MLSRPQTAPDGLGGDRQQVRDAGRRVQARLCHVRRRVKARPRMVSKREERRGINFWRQKSVMMKLVTSLLRVADGE